MTDQPKFTPGPWFVVNEGTEDEPMLSVKAERIRGRGPTHEVALCATGDSPQDMETANAHLIAAAPDMNEALKGLLGPAFHGSQTRDELLRDWGALGVSHIDAARAALRKAEGGKHG